MRLVKFTAILPDGAHHPVRVNPDEGGVLGISPPRGPNGPILDRCEIRAPDGPMVVVGSVDEVAAALLGVAAPVAGEPDDLDAAAAIIDLLAEASESDGADVWDHVGVGMVDDALGLVNGDFEDTSRHLRALAARLRGGTP